MVKSKDIKIGEYDKDQIQNPTGLDQHKISE